MKKILNFVLKLLVSAVLLYFFLSRIDTDAVIQTLKQTDIPLFIAGFSLYLCTVFVSTKRWSLFLPQGLKYSKLVSLYFIGSFFNTFLPGIVGGDAVKAFYLYRHIGKGGLSIAAVFMDRYMGLCAMGGIAFLALIAGYPFIKETEILWFILIFLGAFVAGSVIMWKVNWGRLKFLNNFYIPLMEYKRKKDIIFKGIILGFIVQGIWISSTYVLSLSIGFDVPIIYFFMFLPIISAASALPVTLAGLGIREAGFILLFSKVGLTSEEALSLSLLVFISMCLLNLIGGVEYLRIGKPPEEAQVYTD